MIQSTLSAACRYPERLSRDMYDQIYLTFAFTGIVWNSVLVRYTSVTSLPYAFQLEICSAKFPLLSRGLFFNQCFFFLITFCFIPCDPFLCSISFNLLLSFVFVVIFYLYFNRVVRWAGLPLFRTRSHRAKHCMLKPQATLLYTQWAPSQLRGLGPRSSSL